MRRIAGNTIHAALLGAALLAPVATAYADAASMDWTSVAQKVLPSVVNVEIETLHDKHGVAGRGRAVGTGFIIDPSGFIVTNKHVVNGAFRITVTLADRSQWVAQLVGAGQVLDIAVLKINVGHPLPALQFGDASTAEVAEPIMVVGNPLALVLRSAPGSLVHCIAT